MSDDFDFEPIAGLPERPPVGEDILWQGRPSTAALARDAYHIRWIAAYFALIVLWRAGAGYADGGTGLALAMAIPYALLGAAGLGVVWLLAFAQARTAVYTITSSRVALRIGAALPVTFNIPFAQLASAHLDLRRDGTGTIALETAGDTRIGYLVAWPHLRPGHARKTQPALRSIPEAAAVARLLAEAAKTRLLQPVVTRNPVGAPALAAE
jgi:Bacterial PH domain